MSTPSRPGVPHGSRPPAARPPVPRAAAPRSAAPRSAQSRPAAARPAQSRPPASPATASATPRRASTGPVPVVEAAPLRGSFAALLSWRTLVLAGVVGLAITLVLPSIRVYSQQQAELHALQAERDDAQGEVDNLTAQIARWDDPAFVVAQARERLAYVFPGETPFRVVDPEYVTAAPANPDASADQAAQGPWFTALWNSVTEVGDATVPPPPAPASPDPTDADGDPLTTVDFGG